MPPLYQWEAVEQPRAAVQILHGMAEHGARYARFAAALNAAGYVVWAHDHRGHGRNPTTPVGLGHFADRDGWRALVDDAALVGQQMRSAFPELPLFLFAHSMGSFVAQSLIAERGSDYRGVVLCGSDGPRGFSEGALRMMTRGLRSVVGGRKPGAWVDSLVFGTYNRQFRPQRTRLDWLSRDEREVDLYIGDALCGFPLTVQSWLDFLEGKKGLGTAEHIARIPAELPIFIIGGMRDPVGDNGSGLERLAGLYRAGGLRVECRLYEGARHELLNETNRDEVTRDVIDWLEDAGRRPALPGT